MQHQEAIQSHLSNVELNLDLWPRQFEVLESEGTEILFGGASEGGKSHLVRIILITFCTMIPNLQCCLIRKKFTDIKNNHVEGPTGFKNLLKPLVNLKQVKIVKEGVFFSNGSNITFTHCQDERQFDSAQGVEKHILAIDEATQISARLIKFFRAWCRMSLDFKKTVPAEWRHKLPLIIYTANPMGASVGHFRHEFVKARGAFQVEDVAGFKRQYIPSRITDNPSADATMQAGRLSGLDDEGLVQALIHGDWDAPIGDFFKNFREDLNGAPHHVVPDFYPPEHWIKWRAFDWGHAEPFCVLWFAVSDGEDFYDHLGRKRWFRRGCIVVYREWFGCDENNPSKGARITNKEICEGILDRTLEEDCTVTVTDSLPFQSRGGEIEMNHEFRRLGVPLSKANTNRIVGWKNCKDRLEGIEGDPMVVICESCKHLRDHIPLLPRHSKKLEDAVESGEATHSCDTWRMGLMVYPVVKDKPKQEWDLSDEPRGFKVVTVNKILNQLNKPTSKKPYGKR